MSAHRGKAILAAAAWKDVNSLAGAYQAAVLRGDADRAQQLRQEAHDMLDTHLDLQNEVAQAAMDILRE